MTKTKSLLRCTFCGKSQEEVEKLIAGPSVFICDECVGLCNEILAEEGTSPKPVRVPRDPREVTTSELTAQLKNAGQLTADLDQRLKKTVDELRSRGYTWAQIGKVLGTSRQAAWERFSSDD